MQRVSRYLALTCGCAPMQRPVFPMSLPVYNYRLLGSVGPPFIDSIVGVSEPSGEAPNVIASRVQAPALDDDEAGVQRWIEIATRYDQLRRVEGGPH